MQIAFPTMRLCGLCLAPPTLQRHAVEQANLELLSAMMNVSADACESE